MSASCAAGMTYFLETILEHFVHQTFVRLPNGTLIREMFSCESLGAANGFTLTTTLITSGYAIILTNRGSPVLYFRVTTFVSGLIYR